jgi:hypothetical protein
VACKHRKTCTGGHDDGNKKASQEKFCHDFLFQSLGTTKDADLSRLQCNGKLRHEI